MKRSLTLTPDLNGVQVSRGVPVSQLIRRMMYEPGVA